MADVKIFANIFEGKALEQVHMLLKQDSFSNEKIRIMPDGHSGAGCVIGFTSTYTDKIIPNIIGVDIGCGMQVIELGKIEIDLPKFDEAIRSVIPLGLDVCERTNKYAKEIIEQLYCVRHLKERRRLESSLGSLGGGNHFIELDEDAEHNKYLVIHTGSRNLGKQVAEYYQNLAIKNLHKGNKEERNKVIAKLKADNRCKDIQSELSKYDFGIRKDIPKDLCYLENKDAENYLHDMKLCQLFAVKNRNRIREQILRVLNSDDSFTYWESVHNYIGEDNIIRKGAISAKLGEKVIIPLNMRDGCIIGLGKGNDDWNNSAPHGAGRIMSRTQAEDTLSVDEFKDTMQGIYSTSVCKETLDESPMAYKPSKEIVESIKPTVDIVNIIKPIYNLKATEKHKRWSKK